MIFQSIINLFRPEKVHKVRDGLISFGDDDWRLEKGPRLLKVVLDYEDESEIPMLFIQRNIPTRYLERMRDATGQAIGPGKPLFFHAWNAKDQWVWYAYQFVHGAWEFRSVIDADEETAISEMKKLMRSS